MRVNQIFSTIVVPLTTKIKKYKGNPILKPNKFNWLKEQAEMLIFHIRSVSKDRLVRQMETIESTELKQAVETLNDVLRY